jgi:zinc D-Ala-D-Ala carboxypeptidase
LNDAVKGANNSQHLQGKAADITVGNKYKNQELFDLIVSLDLPFDQLIDEQDYSWIHVSYDETRNRKQILHL